MNNHGCLLLLLQEGSACPSPSHEPLTLLKAPFPLHRLTAALLSRSYGSVSSPGPTTWEGPPCPPFAPAQAPAPPGGPTAPASPLPLPPPSPDNALQVATHLTPSPAPRLSSDGTCSMRAARLPGPALPPPTLHTRHHKLLPYHTSCSCCLSRQQAGRPPGRVSTCSIH